MPATVVIVDDHEVVRDGVRAALAACGDVCEVVGDARSVADALRLVDTSRPDIAILDVVLPDGDGIQLCRQILARHPDTACVLLTSFPEPRSMLSAALAGAAAYLAKDSSATDIAGTVAAVAQGRRPLNPAAVEEILEELRASDESAPRLAQLTPQERRVFELIGQGLSNRQIGERLHLSERTVKNYSSRMMSKLALDRRSEVAALAARLSERRIHGSSGGTMGTAS